MIRWLVLAVLLFASTAVAQTDQCFCDPQIFSFTFVNQLNRSDTFIFNLLPYESTVRIAPQIVKLKPGETRDVKVNLSVPCSDYPDPEVRVIAGGQLGSVAEQKFSLSMDVCKAPEKTGDEGNESQNFFLTLLIAELALLPIILIFALLIIVLRKHWQRRKTPKEKPKKLKEEPKYRWEAAFKGPEEEEYGIEENKWKKILIGFSFVIAVLLIILALSTRVGFPGEVPAANLTEAINETITPAAALTHVAQVIFWAVILVFLILVVVAGIMFRKQSRILSWPILRSLFIIIILFAVAAVALTVLQRIDLGQELNETAQNILAENEEPEIALEPEKENITLPPPAEEELEESFLSNYLWYIVIGFVLLIVIIGILRLLERRGNNEYEYKPLEEGKKK